MENKKQPVRSQQSTGLNIGVDPMRTPVLYADAIMITANENGFVLDVAQRIGSSNQANVVARIGLSKEHVKRLVEKLTGQLSLREGKAVTGKFEIVD